MAQSAGGGGRVQSSVAAPLREAGAKVSELVDVPETNLGIVRIEGIRFSFRTPKGHLRSNKVRLCCFDEDCLRAARGVSGLCIAHGGGKRCEFPGCTSGAENGGLGGYCKRHGGGRRCAHEGCEKSARGSAKAEKQLCIKHGGGKRCASVDCPKAAIGATKFCVAHGGGRRCAFEDGCTKSTQGGSKFCKRHDRIMQVKSGKTKEQCATHKCKLPVFDSDLCVLHSAKGGCIVPGCESKAFRKSVLCKDHKMLELLVAGGLRGEEYNDSICSWAIAAHKGDYDARSLVEKSVRGIPSEMHRSWFPSGPELAQASPKMVESTGDEAGTDDELLERIKKLLVRQQKQLEKLRQLQLQKDAIVSAFQKEQLLTIHKQQAEILREVWGGSSLLDPVVVSDAPLKRSASESLPTDTPGPKRARQEHLAGPLSPEVRPASPANWAVVKHEPLSPPKPEET